MLDLLFVSSADPEEDVRRASAFLSSAGGEISRGLAVVSDARCADALGSLFASNRLPWLAVTGDSSTIGVNRGLLLAERDVIVLMPGVTAHGRCVPAMLAASRAHDRIGAVVPAIDAPGDEEAEWLHGLRLPEIAEIPAGDIGLILIRNDVLRVAGALDASFPQPLEAFADFCLRAQRLGFVTVRALRAVASAWRFDSPQAPRSAGLDGRHPAYPHLRSRADQDVAAGLTRRALSFRRGRPSICLDVRYLPQDAINGTGVYAVELCRALMKHTPSRVSLYCRTETQRRALEQLGAPVFQEGQHVPTVDLLHRPAQVFLPSDLAFLLRDSTPFVLTYQDLIAYRAHSAHAGAREHERYQLVSTLSVRSAQVVVAISQHNAGEIVREFRVPESDVRVVHHGVHAEAFADRDSAANAARLQGEGITGRFFLFVGSDYAHKNLRVLLAAYTRFRSLWRGPEPTPRLAIVGHPSGSVGGFYRDLYAKPPPGVSYLGDVSDEVLKALYQESIALVFLSLYEGFGLPLLEAMAAKTPVLCTRYSSLPEVGADAVLYAEDPSDEAVSRQLLDLATDEKLRQDLAGRGAERVRQFTWEETARRTFAAYEHALTSPSSGSLAERRVALRLLDGL